MQLANDRSVSWRQLLRKLWFVPVTAAAIGGVLGAALAPEEEASVEVRQATSLQNVGFADLPTAHEANLDRFERSLVDVSSVLDYEMPLDRQKTLAFVVGRGSDESTVRSDVDRVAASMVALQAENGVLAQQNRSLLVAQAADVRLTIESATIEADALRIEWDTALESGTDADAARLKEQFDLIDAANAERVRDLVDLEDRIADLDVQEFNQISTLVVVGPQRVEAIPASQRLLSAVVFGAACGLAIGLLLLSWYDARRAGIRGGAHVRRRLPGVRVVAAPDRRVLPGRVARAVDDRAVLVVAPEGNGSELEAFEEELIAIGVDVVDRDDSPRAEQIVVLSVAGRDRMGDLRQFVAETTERFMGEPLVVVRPESA